MYGDLLRLRRRSCKIAQTMPQNKPKEPGMGDWYSLAGLGFEFIAAVLLGTGVGWAIDRWLETSPWGIIVGVGLGFAVGLRGLIKRGMRSFKD
jgi:F0F1-type ATP synthase assembly protein I